MPKVSEQHIVQMQEKILQAAVVCFADNGFHATGMAQIIKASGVAAGSVYRYYKSKDELILAIVERHLQQMQAQVMSLEAVTTPLALIESCLAKIEKLKQTEEVIGFAKVLPQVWTEVLRNPAISAVVTANYDKILHQFEHYLSEMQQAGTLDKAIDCKMLAQIIWSLVHGYSLQSLLFEPIDKASYLQTLTMLIDKG